MSLFASMQTVRDNLPEAKEGAFQDRGPVISFDGVTVVTPAGQTLLKDLSFEVTPGDRLLICGHNGAGKSSIIRCLSALWAIPKGVITRPGGTRLDADEDDSVHSQIYYLPQKPCSVIGSLSDQLTYPQRLSGGLPDDELRRWLRCVDLEYLADRNAGQQGGLGKAGGGNEVDWEQLLSLGEQQALAIARLFYHHPHFAILDECTSAVSSRLEQRLFGVARKLGITFITITHRPALQALHTRMLQLTGHMDKDGQGWELMDIPHSEPLPPVESRVASKEEALLRAKEYLSSEGSKPAAALADQASTKDSSAKADTPGELVHRRWPSSWARFKAVVRLGLQEPGRASRLLGRLAAIALGMRVHCDLLWQIWAGQNGAISAALTGNTNGILAELVSYLMTAPIISLVDTAIKYQGRLLASELSESISHRLLRMAFSAGSFVSVMRPGSPLHVENPMTRLSELNSHVSSVSTALIDLFFRCSFGLFSLRTLLRGVGPIAFLSPPTYFLVFRLCLLVAPDFVYLSKREAELEARFQVWHTRLRHVAEPVAFSGGGPAERRAIEPHFDAVLDFKLSSLRKRFFYRFVENLFTGHSEIPLYMQRLMTGQFSSRNVAYNPTSGVTPGVVVQGFMFERVVMYNDNTAHRLGSFTPTWRGWDGTHVRLLELAVALEAAAVTEGSLAPGPEGGRVEVENLDLVSPAGRCLARGLSFAVSGGEGLVVSGPNACGKTLLGSVLLGLWPAQGSATVRLPGLEAGAVRPPLKLIMAAPQRLYLPMGTLGDQVCYPSRYTPGVQGAGEAPEAAMERALAAAGIAYLVGREARGWLHECRWEDVLSGGEQQRMGVARVMYQRPKFALLDECTSMVAHDSEEGLYRTLARDLGVTPITLSQRLFMPETHAQELKLGTDDAGSWSLIDLGKAEATRER